MSLLRMRFSVRLMMIAVAVLGLLFAVVPPWWCVLVPVTLEAGHDNELQKPGRDDDCL